MYSVYGHAWREKLNFGILFLGKFVFWRDIFAILIDIFFLTQISPKMCKKLTFLMTVLTYIQWQFCIFLALSIMDGVILYPPS